MNNKRPLLVADYMNRDPMTLGPEMLAVEAIERLVNTDVSGAPVILTDKTVVGWLSAKDCMLAVRGALYFSEPPNFTVRDLMTTTVEAVSPQTTLVDAAERFSQRPYRRLPVMVDSRLVGVLRRHHVLAAYLDTLTGITGDARPRPGRHAPAV